MRPASTKHNPKPRTHKLPLGKPVPFGFRSVLRPQLRLAKALQDNFPGQLRSCPQLSCDSMLSFYCVSSYLMRADHERTAQHKPPPGARSKTWQLKSRSLAQSPPFLPGTSSRNTQHARARTRDSSASVSFRRRASQCAPLLSSPRLLPRASPRVRSPRLSA